MQQKFNFYQSRKDIWWRECRKRNFKQLICVSMTGAARSSVWHHAWLLIHKWRRTCTRLDFCMRLEQLVSALPFVYQSCTWCHTKLWAAPLTHMWSRLRSIKREGSDSVRSRSISITPIYGQSAMQTKASTAISSIVTSENVTSNRWLWISW
jgi:hypothetical protein